MVNIKRRFGKLAAKLTGQKKNALYERALRIKPGKE